MQLASVPRVVETVTAQSMGRIQQPILQGLVHDGGGNSENNEVLTEPVFSMIWGPVHVCVVCGVLFCRNSQSSSILFFCLNQLSLSQLSQSA